MSDFGAVVLAELDAPVPDVADEAPDVVLPVEPVPAVAALPGVPVPVAPASVVAVDPAVPDPEVAVLEDVVSDGEAGVVVVAEDDDVAGGGVTMVVEDDEVGGAVVVAGGESWRCWHAPSASITPAAAAVTMKRFICSLLGLLGVKDPE